LIADCRLEARVSENIFADLVKKHFAFLLSDYGFQISEILGGRGEAMGNAAVTLESAHGAMQIVNDRGQVLISIGPSGTPRREWFEFSVVVQTYAPEVHPVYIFPTDDAATFEVRLETQVQRVAELARTYCQPALRGHSPTAAEIKATYYRYLDRVNSER
jgi:hypothetical protein